MNDYFWGRYSYQSSAYVHTYPGKSDNRGTNKHHAARVQRSKAKKFN